ncbi:MAG: Spy/CpxP family protein refolding chaperone [Desulfonatronovibrio sp.]
MKTNILLKPVFFLMAVFCFLNINAGMAEAQRGQYHRGQQMMGQQYGQVPDNGSCYYEPGMMGRRYGQVTDNGFGYGPGMMGPGMMSGRTMTDFLNLPGLTDKQREDIRAVERESRREQRELMLDMLDARDDFAYALDADRPDPEQVSQLHEAMSRKQREMLTLSIEIRNRIYDLLSEEQRGQVRDYQRRSFDRPYRWPR